MKILYINCVVKLNGSYSMPLSVGYLTTYLRERLKPGLQFKAVSTPDMQRIMAIVKEFKPDLIGLSVTTPAADFAKEMATLVKKARPKTIIVAGGPHITLFPQDVTREMDYAVMGEGEETFFELIAMLYPKLVRKERRPAHSGIDQINGLIYWKGKSLAVNKSREFITQLDDIGHPDRTLLNPTNNTIFSSRGCPFNCIFCSSVVLWKRKFRMHTAQYVYEEIRILYERKHSVQWFSDDLFTCNKQRIRELIALLREGKLLGRVTFLVLGRSNMVDEEMAQLLKELNVAVVFFGFESGDDRILKYAKRSNIGIENHITAAKLCRKYKILVGGYLMIGFPGETHESVMNTFNFSKEHNDTGGIPNFLMVFPKTDLEEDVKKRTGKDYAAIHLEKLRTEGGVPVAEDTKVCDDLSVDEIKHYQKMFAEMGRMKNVKYYMRLSTKLVFSKSFFLNMYYFYNIAKVAVRNPKREHISETLRC